MSFDDIQPGTNITDQAFNVAGTTVTFKTWTYNSVASGVSATSDLIVVDAASTVTPPVGFSYFGGSTTVDTSPWKLHATSGDNILSPGGPELRAGPNPQYETDGIEIDFDPPVKAVGMDFLFQSLDCCLFTSVATFDASGQQILTGGLPGNGGPGGSPSGNVFYGIVSGTANIARIRVAETDGSGDFPDTNLAYDSLRLVPGAPAVTCGAAGSSATTAPTPPSGLVARWLADGNANDAVGTHNGAPQNGAGYAIGRSGQAFCFDGTDDFFQMPDSDDWAFGTGDFTVSTWVNFDTAPGGTVVHPDAIFVANDEGAGWTNKWFFSLGGGMLYFGASNPSGPAGVPGDYYAQTPFTPTPGTWYHVAARRANGTFTTFVNGTAGTSQFACGAMPNPNAPLTMGLTEGLGHFDGRMDDVQIYRRALTEAELQTLAGQPATGSTTLPAAQTCPGDPPGGGGGSGSPIELTKDGPATANVGEQLTYRIRTKNNATTPATNVHVIDQVPAGLHIVSITPDPGMTCTGLNVNPVVCTIPVLQPQEIK